MTEFETHTAKNLCVGRSSKGRVKESDGQTKKRIRFSLRTFPGVVKNWKQSEQRRDLLRHLRCLQLGWKKSERNKAKEKADRKSERNYFEERKKNKIKEKKKKRNRNKGRQKEQTKQSKNTQNEKKKNEKSNMNDKKDETNKNTKGLSK